MQNCRVIGREVRGRKGSKGGVGEGGGKEGRRVNVKEFTPCQTRAEGVLRGSGCVRVVCGEGREAGCCVVDSGMDTEVVYANLGTVHGCMLWWWCRHV